MSSATRETAAIQTPARPAYEPEQRVLLRGVGWDGYEALLHMVEGGSRHVRITYDSGDAELMSPSRDHERLKSIFGRFMEILTSRLNLNCESEGSTTWRRALSEKAFDPDECFFLGDTFDVSGKGYDSETFPPPDLAVEIELSPASLDRMQIYAAFGVPEVWRFDGETLAIEHLNDAGSYGRVETSPAFPFLKASDINHWVLLPQTMRMTEWHHRFEDWVRREFGHYARPRRTYEGPDGPGARA